MAVDPNIYTDIIGIIVFLIIVYTNRVVELKKKFKILGIIILLLLLISCNNKDIRYINIPTASTTGNIYPFGNT